MMRLGDHQKASRHSLRYNGSLHGRMITLC